MPKYSLMRDILVIPSSGEKWVVRNTFTMGCIGLESEGLELLRKLENSSYKLPMKTIKVWDIWHFSNYKGLMEDPSRFIQSEEDWGDARKVSTDEFLAICLEQQILIQDQVNYSEKFKDKDSILDNINIGNFHQQLGQQLLKYREKPEKWWLNQKFEDNYVDLKNNLYGAIQGSYLSTYFSKKLSKDMQALDIGCGTGFYTKFIAQFAGSVLGVDPSAKYLKIAETDSPDNCTFNNLNIGTDDCLDFLPDSSFDFIFMSDAMLFYFVPPNKAMPPNLDILLTDIKRLLKKDGVFVNMEPHYIFWLAPWLGEPNRPFTILSEYLKKQFKVVPSMSEYIQKLNNKGFSVSWMDELVPTESFRDIDPRAYNFATEFPLWQIFEFTHTNPWRFKEYYEKKS